MLKPIKGHPGRFLDIGTGKVLNISEYREDDKYDTVMVWDNDGSQPLPSGRQFIFFRDVTKKKPLDTNFSQPSKLNAGETMIIDRVGIYVRQAAGAAVPTPTSALDAIYVAENAHLRIEMNKLLLTEGPVIKYPSGYGFSVAYNIGFPATGMTTKMMRTQFMGPRHDIIGYLTFYDRDVWMKQFIPAGIGMPTFSVPVLVVCFLHGLIKTAVSR